MKYIITLSPYCYIFERDLRIFMQTTGQPLERFNDIYKECLSQIISKMCNDASIVAYDLMTVPNFVTLNYTETPINVKDPVVAHFRDSTRAFGLVIFETIRTKVHREGQWYYFLESCSLTTAVISTVINADYL